MTTSKLPTTSFAHISTVFVQIDELPALAANICEAFRALTSSIALCSSTIGKVFLKYHSAGVAQTYSIWEHWIASAQVSPYKASVNYDKGDEIRLAGHDFTALQTRPLIHDVTSVEKVNPAGHVQWLPMTAEQIEVGTTASQSASPSHGIRMFDEASANEKKSSAWTHYTRPLAFISRTSR